MKRLIPFIFLLSLTSCSLQSKILKSKIFCFDTLIEVQLYEGDSQNIKDIENILSYYDKVSDNYQNRDVTCVYTINQANEELTLDKDFYDLLYTAFDVHSKGATFFDPLCGSLAKKWKEALDNNQILDDITINAELEKMHASSIEFKENNVIRRLGEAEIDLGGIAKGYALDKVQDYLKEKELTHYLIKGGARIDGEGGASSILFGEKKNKNGLFSIGISELPNNAYIEYKNGFVTTSGVAVQGKKINGVTYSHIINPITGSAINNYDEVIVLSEDGYLGDALSTSMMMNTVEEIKQIETEQNVKVIAIKDGNVSYINPSIEIKHH